jgi:hypothetical protein
MPFTTENAAEMRAKRGRPPAAEKITAPHQERPAPSEVGPPARIPAAPDERMVSVILLRGWWPSEGTIYSAEVGRDHNDMPIMEDRVYTTPVDAHGQIDEMARKRMKLGEDTRVTVPYAVAKKLVNSGSALFDRTL